MLLALYAYCPSCYRYYRYERDEWYHPTRIEVEIMRRFGVPRKLDPKDLHLRARICCACRSVSPPGYTEWFDYIPAEQTHAAG